MIITYYGAYCFKVQSGDVVLAFDPPSKKSDFKAPRFQADMVFVSNDQIDHNGSDNISSKESDKQPFLIDGPGEYEIKGITINGISVSHENTIYVINLDDIVISYLGDLKGKNLDSDTLEFLSDTDILIMSNGGNARNIVNKVEAKVVIPMFVDKKDSETFLKEMSQEKIKPLEKFSFKKKDIVDKKGEVVLLAPLIN